MTKSKTIVRNIDGVTHIIQKKSKRQRFVRWFKRSKLPSIVGLVLLVLCVGVAAFLFQQKHSEPQNVDQVIAAVGRHMILPQNEKPILATVTDRSALRTPFLKEANNGDKVLFYEKTKRVIIYRPSLDRIVDVGPVELSNIPRSSN